jgi:hypothetical protein
MKRKSDIFYEQFLIAISRLNEMEKNVIKNYVKRREQQTRKATAKEGVIKMKTKIDGTIKCTVKQLEALEKVKS